MSDDIKLVTTETLDRFKTDLADYWKNIPVQAGGSGGSDSSTIVYTPEKYSWATASASALEELFDAVDNGEIDLQDYWAIGDERTVHLSAISANVNGAFTTAMDAQDVVWTIMNFGYENQAGIHIVWGQKNLLNQEARMNASHTNSGSWNGCAMKADLNNLYYNAIPAEIKALVRDHVTTTASVYNGSANQTTTEKISLFAEKEIFGSVTYSNSIEAAELTQIEYYKTSANRIKYNVSGSAYYYWERSPSSCDSDYFCYVRSNGNAYNGSAGDSYGAAPFGCM